jgi:hypothetical protein
LPAPVDDETGAAAAPLVFPVVAVPAAPVDSLPFVVQVVPPAILPPAGGAAQRLLDWVLLDLARPADGPAGRLPAPPDARGWLGVGAEPDWAQDLDRTLADGSARGRLVAPVEPPTGPTGDEWEITDFADRDEYFVWAVEDGAVNSG